MNYTEEQLSDIKSRVDLAAKEVSEVLKKYEVQIFGKPVKHELLPGVFGDSVNVGYIDTKYAPKQPSAEVKEGKVELKED